MTKINKTLGIILVLLNAVYFPSHVVALEFNDTKIYINNGWYIELFDEPVNRLTTRIYANYYENKQEYRLQNLLSFRYEVGETPYLSIIIPNELHSIIEKFKLGRYYINVHKVFIKGQFKSGAWIGWLNDEISAVTIYFPNGSTILRQRMVDFFDITRDNFTLIIPINKIKPLIFKYSTTSKGNEEIKLASQLNGREFVLQNKMEFLDKCNDLELGR